MINLPAGLANFMKGQKFDGLKPFAILFRNKWVLDDESESESGGDMGHFEIDTANPIDISAMIAKPNTLSMTLDVNEIAQYNCNNITLSLSDPQNRFIEGVPGSFFPDGYQLYGSRVVLYYGTDNTNRTPIFTGVIKELPTHKPEKYQVDLKLVSPLEMLKDIEAKEFSNKYIGETLTYSSTDEEGHKIYVTSGVGVGGFNAVYADGEKLFEGIDYEVEQINVLGTAAQVKIIKPEYYSSTITADYYTWKTSLTVEQIVSGLVAIAGYDSTNEDIRNVVWNTSVRGEEDTDVLAAIGYTKNGTTYETVDDFNDGNFNSNSNYTRHSVFPDRCKVTIGVYVYNDRGYGQNINDYLHSYYIGADYGNGFTGVLIRISSPVTGGGYRTILVDTYKYVNGTPTGGQDIMRWQINTGDRSRSFSIEVEREGATVRIKADSTNTYTFANDFDFGNAAATNERMATKNGTIHFTSYKIELLDDDTAFITNKGLLLSNSTNTERTWTALLGNLVDDTAQYVLKYRAFINGEMTEWQGYQFYNDLGISTAQIQISIEITSGFSNIQNLVLQYLSDSIAFALVSLPGKNILEAIQDLALISGYEFGVDRNGVFFFRPRLSSTTPIYELGMGEVEKVDTVKKNLSDFFTKLTLNFAQIPLEFYANTGAHPTPIDRYGVINKDIDKPDIVNYDNPELAQAIGPQLLAIYSALPGTIQAVGKLNLALELGDIVNLKRNYPLSANPAGTDYEKYERQDTYSRACKVTGMNYNFDKKQITYTLRDVSDNNNRPTPTEENTYMYEFPLDFGG